MIISLHLFMSSLKNFFFYFPLQIVNVVNHIHWFSNMKLLLHLATWQSSIFLILQIAQLGSLICGQTSLPQCHKTDGLKSSLFTLFGGFCIELMLILYNEPECSLLVYTLESSMLIFKLLIDPLRKKSSIWDDVPFFLKYLSIFFP